MDFFASLPRPSLSEESVGEVIENALVPFLQDMEKRGIGLTVGIEDCSLLLDKELVTSVFSILIANALDALPDGGRIMIHDETNDFHCNIYVSDTGSGISNSDIAHIFNPFFSTKPDGAGIDLATAKRIMDYHGGRIEVASKKGNGTSFTLQFPLERRQSIRVSPLEKV